MGAESRIWVKAIVAEPQPKWIEVSAVTLQEAHALVARMPHVVCTLDAMYDRERDADGDNDDRG
jgi:hypothetical protein